MNTFLKSRETTAKRELDEWDWSEKALRSTSSSHEVQLFDLTDGLDWRTIKILRNGTTVIHCEPDGSRGVPVLLRLEKSHGTLTWSRTPWNGGLVGGDLSLFSNPDVEITHGLKLKYGLGPSPPGSAGGFGGSVDGEVSGGGVEEGYLDVSAVKEVALSCREGDFISIARRYGNSPPGHVSALSLISAQNSHTDAGRRPVVHLARVRPEPERQPRHRLRLLAARGTPLVRLLPGGAAGGQEAAQRWRQETVLAQGTVPSTLLHVIILLLHS